MWITSQISEVFLFIRKVKFPLILFIILTPMKPRITGFAIVIMYMYSFLILNTVSYVFKAYLCVMWITVLVAWFTIHGIRCVCSETPEVVRAYLILVYVVRNILVENAQNSTRVAPRFSYTIIDAWHTSLSHSSA